MTKIRCYICGKMVERDSYALHHWNYHDNDIRSLAKKGKRKRNKRDLVKGAILGSLITLGGIYIYILF